MWKIGMKRVYVCLHFLSDFWIALSAWEFLLKLTGSISAWLLSLVQFRFPPDHLEISEIPHIYDYIWYLKYFIRMNAFFPKIFIPLLLHIFCRVAAFYLPLSLTVSAFFFSPFSSLNPSSLVLLRILGCHLSGEQACRKQLQAAEANDHISSATTERFFWLQLNDLW